MPQLTTHIHSKAPQHNLSYLYPFTHMYFNPKTTVAVGSFHSKASHHTLTYLDPFTIVDWENVNPKFEIEF